MTQNNFRKEPVFGEPSISNQENEAVEQNSNGAQNTTKPYVSLHSTKAPGHTFTPIMKRPEPATDTQPAEDIAAKTAKEFQFTPSVEKVENDEALHVTDHLGDSAQVVAGNHVEINEAVETSPIKPVVSEGFTTERVIPNASTAAAGAAVAATAAAAVSKADNMKAKLPPKTRRLLLVALLGLALLVLFFLLKPSTPETVEELQSQQGGSLPIEFRPVDEAEAKRAEEQARAEQEAAAKAQEQQAQQDAATAAASEPVQSEPVTTPAPSTPSQPAVEQPVAVKPVVNKPVVSQPVIKPKTEGSVVFQPETAKPAKVERVSPQPQKEQPKVVAKPAEKAPVKTEAAKAATPAAATATKTMTVPKGVSLMQVFRDNNLNISDVNAMSKANNIVSNLKVGERVTVRLDKNNRVVEMSIGSGGKFTRQANGSYTFK